MKLRTCLLALGMILLPSSALAQWFELMMALSGGNVFDAAKVSQLGKQYIVDSNKLNQLNATDQSARDQLVALQAMRATYGDGSGVEAYVPTGTVQFSPEMQRAVADYAKRYPNTPQGETMRAYLARQNERETQLQLYAQRVRAAAQVQQREGLTLTEMAAIENELQSQAMDVRLEAIAAAADANATKTLIRQRQLEIREYQQARALLENAIKE